MERRISMAGAAVFALLLATAAGAAPKSSAADQQVLDKGRALVLRNCGMCHATGPMGRSPNGNAPPFRDLHQHYDIEDLSEALGEGIITGHPSMPEFRFEPAEVKAIIHYLKSIQSKQHAAEDLGSAQRTMLKLTPTRQALS